MASSAPVGKRTISFSDADAGIATSSAAGPSASAAAPLAPPSRERSGLLAGSDSSKKLAAASMGVFKSVGTGFTNVAGTGVGALKGGFEGLASSGRGFREFVLKGTVVELAIAVVVG